ncbi:MAG TPA: DUF4123 domain-containing protein [Variovorax sp.]|nr:DUF4123 domain-containing protein [Variovorax sp.]
MKTFALFDGAMAHGTVRSMPAFAAPDASWVTTLMTQEAARLVGPVLMDLALFTSQCATFQADARELVSAFPHELHVSLIDTDDTLGLEELAAHLRRFTHFGDGQGQSYGLRIADCRVLAYLPQVLTPDQWNALTAPMRRWRIHDRKGQAQPLELHEARLASVPDATALHLDPDQIEHLMDAGEADALLAAIGRPPEATPLSDVQRHFDLASQCVERWRASGSHDRGQLPALTRRSFDSKRIKS